VDRHKLCFLRREFIAHLLLIKAVLFDFENFRAVWFGQILTFSDAQRKCFRVLWENFLNGNLPIPHEKIINAWEGESRHISYLFKRHPAWTEKVIVSDGRGLYWLRVPMDDLFYPSKCGPTDSGPRQGSRQGLSYLIQEPDERPDSIESSSTALVNS